MKPFAEEVRGKSNLNEYIKAEQYSVITKALRFIMCEHPDWYKHGLGFQCAKCDYYTGTNSALNKAIEELSPKRKE